MYKKTMMLLFAILVAGFVSCNKTEEPQINHAPAQPSAPTGPDSVLIGVNSQFSASATDPDGDSVSLRFAWGDGDTSLWSNFVASGGQITMEHAYTAGGTYSIRVQARDTQGAESSWSPSKNVTVLTLNYPPRPTLSGIDTGYVDTNYMFQCTVIDPEGDQVSVRIAWGDGDTTAWTDFQPSGTTFSFNHTFSSSGNFMISAQARDDRGGISSWIAPKIVVIRFPFPFAMTSNTYPDSSDLNAAVQSELGPDYTVADWNDVKAWCQEHSAAEFIQYLNWELGEQYSLLVTWNGQGYWNGRHYYMTRFDHNPPIGFHIHDEIENNYIVLGSWSPVSFRILAIKR